MSAKSDESREGVSLTNLDQPLFDGADATKRDLVDYLDAVADRILPVLENRPLSVIRVHRGQEAFMQKNVPKYTPEWVRTVTMWAETSKREVSYALVQRPAHAVVVREPARGRVPPGAGHGRSIPTTSRTSCSTSTRPRAARSRTWSRCARLVREALAEVGLAGALKTSGAKGVHVFVPVDADAPFEDSAAATRAIAARVERLDPELATTAFVKDERAGKVFVDSTRVGGATVVAAYSPRVRPGVPVSFPVGWDDLDAIAPGDFTIHTALEHLGDGDPWADQMVAPQTPERRAHRRGSRHPGRTRAGDARRKTPRPGAAHLARTSVPAPSAPRPSTW